MNTQSQNRMLLVASLGVAFGLEAARAADDTSAAGLLRQATVAAVEAAGLPGEAAAFRTSLLESTDWQHDLFDSGPITEPAEAIGVLYALWQADSSLADEPIDRAMATACGLEGPRRYGAEGMVDRFMFFRDHWRAGRLNDLYAELSVFERRFLAAGVQHGHFNTIASMEYQLAEVALPVEQYTGACWYAGYRLHNAFGDSIQGPHYYEPFRSSWSSAAEMVRNVGGVCGSLSNFGASAAIANGVPAVTMGEPGHCAYAVMVGPGNWTPAYSLSWQRGVHTQFHGGTWGWHLFAVAGQADPDQARRAGDLRRLGEWQLASGQPSRAIETLAEACRNHPLDYASWLARIDAVGRTNAPREAWVSLHDDLLGGLVPDHPEVAWAILKNHIYPQLLQAGDSHLSDRREHLLAFHRALSGWGSCRWDFAGSLRQQQTLLSTDTQQQDAFGLAVFRTHADDPVLASAVLEAALTSIGDDIPRRQQFLAGILEAVGDEAAATSADTITSLARRLLPEAAAAGDKSTFQFIGRLAGSQFPPCDITPEPFPGSLLSSGGTLAVAAAGNRYDSPEQHWGVIEPHGGFFHTLAKPATVTVQLGNYGRLSGVVIVQRPSHIGRLNAAKLQVSANGEDWDDVHTFTNSQRVERVDLQGRELDAGYVRVLQEEGESLHFNRFLVFGEKQN